LAVSAADAVERSGILGDRRPKQWLETQLISILQAPLSVDGARRRYRFPEARARQLAATSCRVRQEEVHLQALIDRFPDAKAAREWFVVNAPGFGAKQASMFLRNIGMSYDLAILDRHVLAYMDAIGLLRALPACSGNLARYSQYEERLRSHALTIACPVGIMDWAIWIVMRVARRQES
jgi:N-glycosylase/DNA lyase